MSKYYFSILFLLFFSINLATAQCDDCSNYGTITEVTLNETYSATAAQAYYWEVCSGSITILGSNTGQTVNIECNAECTAILKVTRFDNGVCEEACIEISCPVVDPPECIIPNSCLAVQYQGSPQKCEFAWISFDSDCLSEYDCQTVQLSMILAGQHQITFPIGNTFGSWNLPNGNWNGTQLVGIATVFCDGLECEIYQVVDLDCYVGKGGDDGPDPFIKNGSDTEYRFDQKTDTKDKASIYRDQVSFNLDKDELIESVQIYNIAGQPIDYNMDKYSNQLTLKQYKTGILKAIITTNKGIFHSTLFVVE